VLLVDDREPEAGEARVAVEQRVRAEKYVDLSRLESGGDAPPFGRGGPVGQERDPYRSVGEQ
jgi:hypothetical protein